MGNIVGIDLGTTNSIAAFKFATTEIVTAPDNPAPNPLSSNLPELDRRGRS